MGSAALVGFPTEAANPAENVAQEKPLRPAFEPPRRELLRAVMDEIIPAGDNMPAASEVGGVEYLDRLARENRDIYKALASSLSELEELSRKGFKKSFVSLSRSARVKVLTQLEKEGAPDSFNALRDFVYEAYYTQPKVWESLGYEFYPTNEAGPDMKPFDAAVLAQVRKKSKLYREVS